MRRTTYVTIWIAGLGLLACSSSNFGGANGKSDKKQGDAKPVQNADDDGGEGDDDGADGPGVDGDPEGSRVAVDCSDSTATECKEKVVGVLGDDGDAQVEVSGCKDDETTTCGQIDELGDTEDQVVLGDGGGASDEAVEEDGELNVKDLAIGVGGPEKPAYFFRNTKKDREAALDCAHQTQEQSEFNPNAEACRESVRIGRVKFQGSTADAEKRAEATLPEQCVCRDGSSSPIPGIVWDKASLQRPGAFKP
jgi:hypothetical protein